MFRDITDTFSVARGVKGQLTVALVEESTGKIVKWTTTPNIITFRANDIMAKVFGGEQAFALSHMVVGGDIAAPGVFPVVTRTDETLDPITDPLLVPTAARVELSLTAPSFSILPSPTAPAGLQKYNAVTYTAIMPSLADTASMA